MVNTAPVRSVRFGGGDGAVQGLDEAARDREPQAGAGAHLVALLRRDRTCRRCAPGRSAGMPSPSSRTCRRTLSSSRQLWMRMVVSGGAYLAALSSRLNSTCSNSTASTIDHRQVGGDLDLHAVPGQDLAGALAARCRRSRRCRAARRSARRRRTRAWSCRADWR